MSVEAVLEKLNDDRSVKQRLSFADAVFLIIVGQARWRFAFRAGSVRETQDTEDCTIEIDPAAWALFALPAPPPGYHDIYALAETGRARVSGDFLTFFRYSFVLKDVAHQLAKGRMFG